MRRGDLRVLPCLQILRAPAAVCRTQIPEQGKLGWPLHLLSAPSSSPSIILEAGEKEDRSLTILVPWPLLLKRDTLSLDRRQPEQVPGWSREETERKIRLEPPAGGLPRETHNQDSEGGVVAEEHKHRPWRWPWPHVLTGTASYVSTFLLNECRPSWEIVRRSCGAPMGSTRASWVSEVRSWPRTCVLGKSSLRAGSEVAEGGLGREVGGGEHVGLEGANWGNRP